MTTFVQVLALLVNLAAIFFNTRSLWLRGNRMDSEAVGLTLVLIFASLVISGLLIAVLLGYKF